MSAFRHLASLAKPKKGKIIPHNMPLTTATLRRVKDTLAALPCQADSATLQTNELDLARADTYSNHAAVLVPLVNIEDKPAILFQVRANVRTHSGEVR